jgi:hypothetical protein
MRHAPLTHMVVVLHTFVSSLLFLYTFVNSVSRTHTTKQMQPASPIQTAPRPCLINVYVLLSGTSPIRDIPNGGFLVIPCLHKERLAGTCTLPIDDNKAVIPKDSKYNDRLGMIRPVPSDWKKPDTTELTAISNHHNNLTFNGVDAGSLLLMHPLMIYKHTINRSNIFTFWYNIVYRGTENPIERNNEHPDNDPYELASLADTEIEDYMTGRQPYPDNIEYAYTVTDQQKEFYDTYGYVIINNTITEKTSDNKQKCGLCSYQICEAIDLGAKDHSVMTPTKYKEITDPDNRFRLKIDYLTFMTGLKYRRAFHSIASQLLSDHRLYIGQCDLYLVAPHRLQTAYSGSMFSFVNAPKSMNKFASSITTKPKKPSAKKKKTNLKRDREDSKGPMEKYIKYDSD